VIIIHEGKIVAEDRIENLSSLLAGSRRIRLEIEGPSKEILACLRKVKGITHVSYSEPYYTVDYPASVDLRGKITEALARGGFTLLALESVTMSLEDIFLKLTTEEETGS
jgi:ABC-2 type transport system ATP-binding protein